MTKRASAALLAALLLAACVGGDDPRAARERAPRRGDAPRARRTTTPEPRPRVVVQSRGAVAPLIRRAVEDVRAIGFWRELTGHLYVVELDSRPGRANVPPDGHLADAYYTGVVDRRGAGGLCDVMFFPTAIDDDLVRWRTYHSQGIVPEEPPTMRRFWASLLAHELAHCGRGRRGEAYARDWEERARDALEKAGI